MRLDNWLLVCLASYIPHLCSKCTTKTLQSLKCILNRSPRLVFSVKFWTSQIWLWAGLQSGFSCVYTNKLTNMIFLCALAHYFCVKLCFVILHCIRVNYPNMIWWKWWHHAQVHYSFSLKTCLSLWQPKQQWLAQSHSVFFTKWHHQLLVWHDY